MEKYFFSDKLWTPCFSKSTTMLFLLIQMTVVEAFQVIGGNVTMAQGGTVVLPCLLTDKTQSLTQITWQRMTRGKPQEENFLVILPKEGPKFINGHDDRFKFIGSIKGYNGSLQLSNVTLTDEGTYTCIFTLFPSGNHKTEILLNLLVPPVSSVEDNRPALGNEEVPLVTCTAAGSKPPAEVRWNTRSLSEGVREKNSTTAHKNGTTTTVSSLLGVPTREINHRLVECVITNPALSKEETLNFTLQVYFAPMEVNIHERDKDSFECVTEANPNANFSWSRLDNSWPQSAVRVEAATLQFLSMTSDLNGLYQCEASNTYGTKSGHLYVYVTSGTCVVSWILFCLLLFLNIAAALWYLHKSGKFQRTGEGTNNKRQTGCKEGGGEEEEEGQRLPSEATL